MENEFVPYEQALELKELGFDKPCLLMQQQIIYRNGNLCQANKDAIELFISFGNEIVIAPTFSQAFHFFRNKYGLMHIINPYDFTAEINYLNKRVVDNVYGDFIPHDHLVDDEGEEIKHLSYEEAETACLIKLIEICCKLK
jgi:hypothetical protein